MERVRIAGGEEGRLLKRKAKHDRAGCGRRIDGTDGKCFSPERMMGGEPKGNVWQFSKTRQGG